MKSIKTMIWNATAIIILYMLYSPKWTPGYSWGWSDFLGLGLIVASVIAMVINTFRDN